MVVGASLSLPPVPHRTARHGLAASCHDPCCCCLLASNLCCNLIQQPQQVLNVADAPVAGQACRPRSIHFSHFFCSPATCTVQPACVVLTRDPGSRCALSGCSKTRSTRTPCVDALCTWMSRPFVCRCSSPEAAIGRHRQSSLVSLPHFEKPPKPCSVIPVRRSWLAMSRFPPVEHDTARNGCQSTPRPFRGEGSIDVDNILKIRGKRYQKLLRRQVSTRRGVRVTAEHHKKK